MTPPRTRVPEHELDRVPEGVRPPDSQIAARAYQLYLDRGAADGHDMDDWLQAERELRVEAPRKLAREAGALTATAS